MSPTLRPKHRDQLEVGSGIAPEVRIPRIPATQSMGRLPPNPGEACHPRSAATLDDTLLS